MSDIYRYERRRPSVFKPLFYFFLQLVIIAEAVFVLKVYLDMESLGAVEISIIVSLILFLFVRTIKVINRQKKSSFDIMKQKV